MKEAIGGNGLIQDADQALGPIADITKESHLPPGFSFHQHLPLPLDYLGHYISGLVLSSSLN
jgi:hypothetical protein